VQRGTISSELEVSPINQGLIASLARPLHRTICYVLECSRVWSGGTVCSLVEHRAALFQRDGGCGRSVDGDHELNPWKREVYWVLRT
jgi:hypothetical protein